jgi:YihY family inner membrane protein
MSLGTRLQAIDRVQQRNPPLAFLAAVLKKFGEDGAGRMAALIAYYGFLSLFPLLLAFVTILGFVLQGDPGDRASIVHSTLAQFPIIGPSLNHHALKGDGLALAVGLAGAVFAGLGITGAAQAAFDQVWRIPHKERSGFLQQRLRGLSLLAIFGVLSIASTVVAGAVTAEAHGVLFVLAGILIALLVNLMLFFAVFRLLSGEHVATADLWPGIALAAVLWQVLEHLGGWYVNHTVRHAQETYGLFATVIGLLAFLHLGAQILLFAAEVTVVRARKLWPRSILGGPLTRADRIALTESAEVEERVAEENVEVSFDPAASGPKETAAAAASDDAG